MTRPYTTLSILFALSSTAYADEPETDPFAAAVRTTEPLSPEAERASFVLPPGFTIELFAAEPDIGKPINIAFDTRGRLWMTESREYPFAVLEGRQGRDAIKILEDTNGDGRADKFTTFVDNLNIPTGLLPFGRGVIAWSIPNIWFFEDTDGDGHADRRSPLYGPLGWEADTHGMNASFRRGYDGWMYLTHGYNNKSIVIGKDGSRLALDSGNNYRVALNGDRVEPFTTGQVNPFGTAFDANGNLFSADCHTAPIYQLLRGAVYPHFGRPHDGLGFGPVLMEHSHNSTAIAGLAYYDDDRWPEEYRDNILIGNVMTSRINRDRIEYTGSTPRAVEQPDFVRTDDPWFRPVDIQLGPDGAVYVADFYNRIIGHYEVPLDHPGRDRERGRIWRIRYTGAEARPLSSAVVATLSKQTAQQLTTLLADPNLPLRMLATHELVDRGVSSAAAARVALRRKSNPRSVTHAMWVLHRLGKLDASLTRVLARHPDPSVRTHLQKILAETTKPTRLHLKLAMAGLEDAKPAVARAAADAIGRHGQTQAVAAIVARWRRSDPKDTHLIHVLRMALRSLARAPGVLRTAWVTASPEERLMLGDIALGVSTTESAEIVAEIAFDANLEEARKPDMMRHVARYLPLPLLPAFVTRAERAAGDDLDREMGFAVSVADGIRQRGQEIPDSVQQWVSHVATAAFDSRAPRANSASLQGMRLRRAAVLAATFQLRDMAPGMKLALSDASIDVESRGPIARAYAELSRNASVSALATLVDDAYVPTPIRLAALAAIAAGKPWQTFWEETLRTAPHRAQRKLFLSLAATETGARALLDLVAKGRASAYLLTDRALVDRWQSLPAELQTRRDHMTESLSVNSALSFLIEERRNGYAAKKANATRGKAVFQLACATCHSVGGAGGLVGPQLDGAGARGLERLLEDVLDPSRNIDPAFQPHDLTLKNGEMVSGLPRREEGDAIVFADATGREFTVQRQQISKRRPSTVSLMPDNFGEMLTPAQLDDLMAFFLTASASARTDSSTASTQRTAPK